MRTTPTIDPENGKVKSVAGFYIVIDTTSSYTLEPLESFFHSKTLAYKWVREFVARCKEEGVQKCMVYVYTLYRDRKVGKFRPGRGVDVIKVGYERLGVR